MYDVKIVSDSIAKGSRLTTVLATFPRILLAEQNTHRVFSRNTASSRAIPVLTRCDSIEANPFIPESFGRAGKGMRAEQDLDPESSEKARAIWERLVKEAVAGARELAALKTHKEHANRPTEPYAWVSQLITSTEWENYFNLRTFTTAQPEMIKLSGMIKEAYEKSYPKQLSVGEWHTPFVDDQSHPHDRVRQSVARAAAVSYERQLATKTLAEEFKRHDDLLDAHHMSPFEHQACVIEGDDLLEHALHRWDKESKSFVPHSIGNFSVPWLQYRKMLPGEAVFRPNQGSAT
jgi:thymidylate synthase ThyX